MSRKLKLTKKVTYRNSIGRGESQESYPCIILEGKWLTERYGWKIGDNIPIGYDNNRITLGEQQRNLFDWR